MFDTFAWQNFIALWWPSRAGEAGPYRPDDSGVFGNLPRRRLQRQTQYPQTRALVAIALFFQFGQNRITAQQRKAASGHYTLRDRRLGGADRIIKCVLAAFHFSFSGCTYPDHCDPTR